jgi:para-nitrobenzyl esterase
MPFRSTHSKANLYVYKISRVPPDWAKSGLLCGHGGELPYLFNYPEMFADNYDLGLVLDPTTGAKFEVGDLNGNGITGSDGDKEDIITSAGWDSDDSAIAEKLMTVWSNFAKTGDPSTTDLTWPAYTAENDTYVEIGPEAAMVVKTGLDTAF